MTGLRELQKLECKGTEVRFRGKESREPLLALEALRIQMAADCQRQRGY